MAVTLIAAATATFYPHFTSSSSSFYQMVRAAPKFQHLSFVSSSRSLNSSVSQLGWNGLKHLPLITTYGLFFKSKEKKQRIRGKTVHASLFGVGAPEALVIGVVALLVFGPKGLAEVARNLGKTLRAFQPTIRELQDVSREFKSTLEREIGLDEVPPPTNMYRPPPTSFSNDIKQPSVDPNGTPKPEGYTSEDLLKITQEQLAASSPESQIRAPSNIPQELNQDGSPKSESYTSEDFSKITQERVAASLPESPIQTPSNLPRDQNEEPDSTTKTTASTPEVATQNQIQTSEKIDKER